jgi:hypothetical protein
MSTEEILVNFATTFSGAFLAIGLTYFYDKHKAQAQERDDRGKVLNTIQHELELNLERIEGLHNQEREYAKLEGRLNEAKIEGAGYLAVVPDIKLERAAFDTAIFSGKLFLLDQGSLKMLSEEYRKIDVVNKNSGDLRAIGRGPVDKQYIPTIQSLVVVSRGYMEHLQKSIPEAIKSLGKNL